MHGFSQGLFVALCVMSVLNLVVIYNAGIVDRTDYENPLQNYSAQQVQGTVGDPGEAVLVAGDKTPLTGTRCNVIDKEIEVTYRYTWKSMDPGPALNVAGLNGTEQRAPGCIDRVVKLGMPTEVIDATNLTGKPTQWKIEGVETPIDPDGNLGNLKYWETNKFTVQPNL